MGVIGSAVTLNYDGLDWGNDEARGIIDFLPWAQKTSYLWLGHNRFGNDGACTLAKGLAMNQQALTHIFLEFNNIGDDGARALADALKDLPMPENSPYWQHLVLYDNRVSADLKISLAKDFESRNHSLRMHLYDEEWK